MTNRNELYPGAVVMGVLLKGIVKTGQFLSFEEAPQEVQRQFGLVAVSVCFVFFLFTVKISKIGRWPAQVIYELNE